MKKIVTSIMTSGLVIMLLMPCVFAAWPTSASVNLRYGQARVNSATVGVSKTGYYTGKNTSLQSKNSVNFGCYAGWITSIITKESSFYVEQGKPIKSHTEVQSRDSRFYISVSSSGACKETATGTVKIK